jgi:hypothetical protein
LDNGRCHRKTDGTAVTVPLGLPNGFLSTIMNFSGSPVTVTFNASEGARKQGSTAGTAKNSFVLAAWNTMFLTKAGDTTWMVAGEVA